MLSVEECPEHWPVFGDMLDNILPCIRGASTACGIEIIIQC